MSSKRATEGSEPESSCRAASVWFSRIAWLPPNVPVWLSNVTVVRFAESGSSLASRRGTMSLRFSSDRT
ncbi:hypothetical protein [Lentzea sp. NBRC 102530]|uniref:hypothetical protein n=1 Tax=Lentzea sp. NBRC 102530 TaxID=3032201 RepID=UPI002554C34A|nr:hypothetical protein [Lentzea sp. NBRC 102530]